MSAETLTVGDVFSTIPVHAQPVELLPDSNGRLFAFRDPTYPMPIVTAQIDRAHLEYIERTGTALAFVWETDDPDAEPLPIYPEIAGMICRVFRATGEHGLSAHAFRQACQTRQAFCLFSRVCGAICDPCRPEERQS